MNSPWYETVFILTSVKKSPRRVSSTSLLCCGQARFHIPRRASPDSSERLRTDTVSDTIAAEHRLVGDLCVADAEEEAGEGLAAGSIQSFVEEMRQANAGQCDAALGDFLCRRPVTVVKVVWPFISTDW